MRLLPLKVFRIQTYHSKEAVCKKLRDITQASHLTRVPYTGEMPFSGSISSDSFLITHSTDNSRNSYVPVMKGTMTENETGTEIEVSMSLFHVVDGMIRFLTFLLLILDFILVVSSVVSKSGSHLISILLSVCIYCGFIFLIHYFFNQEAQRAYSELQNAFTHIQDASTKI